MPSLQLLKEKLFKPVDAITAEVFTRMFGVIILLQVFSFQKFDFINKGILEPKLLFKYDFFEWVKPLPANAMQTIPLLLIISAVLIIINKLRKVGMVIFLLTFSYLFVLEQSYYNNHFYLLILIGIALLFYNPQKDANAGISYIPYWLLFLLQFHIAQVYFYGGLVKLNPDWLIHMEPMKTLLAQSAKSAIIPSINNSTFALYVLTYGGVLFDLCIAFLLWNPRTFKIALIACAVFNMFNYLLFNFGSGGDIGIFPFFMIGACVLFANPAFLRQKINDWFPSKQKGNAKNKKQHFVPDFNKTRNIMLPCLIIYCSFHLLFPFRHLLFAGNTSWTGKASKFAWRMKAHAKKADVRFYYALAPTDSLKLVQAGMVVNTMQIQHLYEDPNTILQLANFLGNDLKKSGYPNPVIKASINVRMNGREPQPLVDSTLNLLTLKHNKWGSEDWVLPLDD